MSKHEVQTATREEMDQCVAVIVLAFANDPAARWMYPDAHQYLKNFPLFVRAFGGQAFEHGSAHYIDEFGAAALWLPPGAHPDEEALVALVEDSVPAKDRETVFGVFEKMGAFHPSEPHWHLPLIGTDPTRQGTGLGSVLLRYALAICDEQQTPAYLEATSDRNVSLYQRHGFKVLGTIRVGTSPPH